MWPFRKKPAGPSQWEIRAAESRKAAEEHLARIPEEHRWRYVVVDATCGSYIAPIDGRCGRRYGYRDSGGGDFLTGAAVGWAVGEMLDGDE